MSTAATPVVAIVAMPWHSVLYPSIQLGILRALLEREGISVVVRSLHVDFADHLQAEAGVSLDEYQELGDELYRVGLGDWIFAVEPYRTPTPAEDERYLEYLRRQRRCPVDEAQIARALRARAAVPAFLACAGDELLATGANVIGFSTTFSQNVASLALARRIKDLAPATKILFGGANCEGPMGLALLRSFPWIDAVVRGEAEAVLAPLVRDLAAGARTLTPRPGVCLRRGQDILVGAEAAPPVSMETVPPPNYDEYFERIARSPSAPEIQGRLRVPFESARGCWWGALHHCTFCGLNGATMAFRAKGAAQVERELLALAARHQRLDFDAVDNIIDLHHVRDLLPRLRDAGIDLRLFYETKSNLTRPQLALMKQAGIHRIQPGIETLSTPILTLMRKGVSALQNVRLLKWCAELGIDVAWNIIWGFPGEPEAEYARMAELLPSLSHLAAPHVSQLRLDRFSPYFNTPAAFGLEILGPQEHYQHAYPVDDGALADLAYYFDYRHVDGRRPEDYAAPLLEAVAEWRAARASDHGALRYRRGPDFLIIEDQRQRLGPSLYVLEAMERDLYLACDGGPMLREIGAALLARGHAVTPARLDEALGKLVEARLMLQEGDRWLSLALAN